MFFSPLLFLSLGKAVTVDLQLKKKKTEAVPTANIIDIENSFR